MRWILGVGKGISSDVNQLQARTDYIRRVTGTGVTPWQSIRVDGIADDRFLCCTSADAFDGTFITAHIGDVSCLCDLRQVREGKLVIANSCIWEKQKHQNLLWKMWQANQKIELYFSMQKLSIDNKDILRLSTTLSNVGGFGFQTSLSERKLFQNRSMGFEKALKVSFEKVCPVLLGGD